MKLQLAWMLVLLASCSQGPAPETAQKPQQAGQAMNPAQTAARIAIIRAAAVTGNQKLAKDQMDGLNNDYRKAVKLSDPTHAVDRESARQAAKKIPGVRSVVWLDHENLFAIVDKNELRTYETIDAICLQLEPLGDTLGVVVNLQSGAARNGDELEILNRNCQLAPGERALLQKNRKVDVIDPEIRKLHKANNPAN